MSGSAEQFDRALSMLLDGALESLSDAECAALRQGVIDEPAQREQFVDAMLMQAALLLDHAPVMPLRLVEPPEAEAAEPARPAQGLSRWIGAAAVAASVLIVGMLWVWSQPANDGASTRTEPTQSLAVLSASHDAKFDTQPLTPGDSLTSQIMRLTQGEVTIDYFDGTAVTLCAPAVYEITGTSAGRLLSGGMIARATPGFAVDTPNFTVIDRGTRFAIWVDESTGGSVLVLDGQVDVQLIDHEKTSPAQSLTEGMGLSVMPTESDASADLINERGRFTVATGDFATLPISEQGRTWVLDDQRHVSFGDVHNIDEANSQTVSLWFNSKVSGRTAFIASKGNSGSTDNGWSVWLDPAGLLMVRASYTGATSDRNLSLSRRFDTADENQWHHLVMIINNTAGTLTAFYDGLGSGDGQQNGWHIGGGGGEVNQFEPGSDFSSKSPILLGARANDMGVTWQGRVNDFVIFNRVLSAREATDLHRLGPTGKSRFIAMPVQLSGQYITSNGHTLATPHDEASGPDANMK
ncbi:hypothetical protein HED60_18400 [Planctomycetales bacterium ZRK34]|nr:hypothetical protein HED60_18400 [Planctomycetales bacterium ZRK34]